MVILEMFEVDLGRSHFQTLQNNNTDLYFLLFLFFYPQVTSDYCFRQPV